MFEVFEQKFEESHDDAETEFNITVSKLNLSDKDLSTFYFDLSRYQSELVSKFADGGTEPNKVLLSFVNSLVSSNLNKLEQYLFQARQDRPSTIAKGISSIEDSRGGADLNIPVLIISHSQGNLFANEIYDTYGSADLDNQEYLSTKFANLQIASPAGSISAPISNQYIHANDIVIKGLNTVTSFEVQESNFVFFNRAQEDSLLEHGFLEVYTKEKNIRIIS